MQSRITLLIFLLPVAANADLVTYQFNGAVSDLTGVTSATSPFLLGQEVTGSFTYDLAANIDSDPSDPRFGRYINAVVDFQLNFGNGVYQSAFLDGTFNADNGGPNSVSITDRPSGDGFIINSFQQGPSFIGEFGAAVIPTSARFNLDALAGSPVFNSDSLVELPDFSEFNFSAVRFNFAEELFENANGELQSSGSPGHIDIMISQVSAIPEPGNAVFALTISASLLLRRKKRHLS